MTTPYYAGDANNLTRLTIPSMGQVEDVPTQRALQAILQWANRLTAVTQLIAGSGITLDPTNGIGPVEVSSSGGGMSLVNWASYSFSGTYPTPGSTCPIPWTADHTNNFNYFPVVDTDIVVPTDTISLFAISGNANWSTPTTNSFFEIILAGVASSYGGTAPAELQPPTAQIYKINCSFPAIYDSANADNPLQVKVEDAGTQDPDGIALQMGILSFTTP